MKSLDLDFCYRELLIILRHSAPLHGLSIGEDGFVSVNTLLELRRFLRLEFKDLRRLVSKHEDELELVKQTSESRSQSEWAIRARDAHTIAHVRAASLTELSIEELQSDVLVYRTTTTNLRRIRAAGEIHRRHQRYISLETRSSGRTESAHCALLSLDVERALDADFKFFRDGFGNIVTTGDCNGALPLDLFYPTVEIIKGKKKRQRRKCPKVDNLSSCEVSIPPAEWYHRPQQWARQFAAQPDVQLQCIYGAISAVSHSITPSCVPTVDTRWRALHGDWPLGDGSERLEDSPVAPNRALDRPTPLSPGALARRADLPESLVDVSTDDSVSSPGSDLSNDVDIITSPPSSVLGWTSELSADVPPFVPSWHCLETMPVSELTRELSAEAPPFVPRWHGRETVPIPDSLEAVTLSQPVSTSTLSEQKWLILPISIPGCGKTGLCVALARLFDFEHLPSGNSESAVRSKAGQSSKFVESVVQSMEHHRVVLVDRNNHLRRHRDEIRKACTLMASRSTPVRTIALQWPIRNPSLQATRTICAKRILSWRHGQEWFSPRTGDSLASVLSTFLREAQPLCEEEVDVVVKMNIRDSLEQALERVVKVLVPLLGLDTPTEEKMRKAIEEAQSYRTHKR